MIGLPQWALIGATVTYPAIHFLSLPVTPTFHRIAQSREILSICHVTLQSVLATICLYQHRVALNYHPTTASRTHPFPPIISTRSVFGQTITAIEAGYLVQDSFVLLQAYRSRGRDATKVKGWNFLHLGLHHAILGGLMLILQYHIYREMEKGILVIVALHLMNISSIFGTIRWFLINSSDNQSKLISLTSFVYLISFALFRVLLIPCLMAVYGVQHGPTILSAMWTLPYFCRLGSGTIQLVNTWWLWNGLRSFMRRRTKRSKFQ